MNELTERDIESPSSWSRISKPNSVWLLFIVFSVLPFFLRIGIDGRSGQRQAFLSLYRDWRFSPAVKNLKPGSEVIFERVRERDTYEEFFRTQLQQDFKVVEFGKFPRVRSFFQESGFLRARFELRLPGEEANPLVWQDEVRMTNNGILLGPWLGLLLFLLNQSVVSCLMASLLVSLFWFSHWDLLKIPSDIYNFFYHFIHELGARIQLKNWNASELSRLADLGALGWLLISFLGTYIFFRQKLSVDRRIRFFIMVTLFLEPVVLWTSGLFAHWGADASWWKVYAGSFGYRFLLGAILFLRLLRPDLFETKTKSADDANSFEFHRLALLMPLIFVICGGWSWLASVFNPDTTLALLRLKIFVVAFVVAFVTGSRVFALWLGALVLSVMVPPTTGHWNSANIFGFFFDASLLGWWLTPFKGTHPVAAPILKSTNVLVSLVLMAWIMGVF